MLVISQKNQRVLNFLNARFCSVFGIGLVKINENQVNKCLYGLLFGYSLLKLLIR